jgi:tRNA 2-selenouridine synthase
LIIPVDIADFLQQNEKIALLDARSPAEYIAGHIPGAISMPLFTDDERHLVGTCYKKEGKDQAVLLGLEFVGPKMASFVKEAGILSPNKHIALHCWRGGMRSGSLAWLLSTAGFKVTLIKGGYKAYRNHVLLSFEKAPPMIILGGMTGSGKTEILKNIARLQYQTIDLEELARHKGSSFGAIGQAPQPSTEQFENYLQQQWCQLDFSRPVFLEDESSTIGMVRLPHPLWLQMRQAPVIKVEIPKAVRIQRLVKEYGCFDKQLLALAIERIRKRLGGQHANAAIQALEQDDLAKVADITLTYYDKAYGFGLADRKSDKIYSLACEEDNPAENAQKVVDYAQQLGLIEKT